MIRRGLYAAAFALVAACAAPPPTMVGGGGLRVEVGGDVFFVDRSGNGILVRNYDTGLRNQDRLFRNAQLAVAQVTDCAMTSFTQRPGVNQYDATLDCAANS